MSRVQIVVTFTDDSERFFPVPEGQSWTFRTERGLSRLVIGQGVPRVEIPLSAVKYWAVEGMAQPANPEQCAVAWYIDGVRVQCDLPMNHPDEGHRNLLAQSVVGGTAVR